MVTEQTNKRIESLRNEVATGKVWNADFEDAKQTLNWAVYRDKDLRDLLLNSGDGKGSRASHEGYPGISGLYWALPSNVHEVASSAKKYAKLRSTCPPNVQETADAFFAFWLPVNELFAVAKTMIVKGRRPSTDVDDSEKRTRENTGTCGVCNGNFKRNDDGFLVNHGYTVEYQAFHGGCPGIGYLPWELSPKGAEDYSDALDVHLTFLSQELEGWKVNGLPKVWVEHKREYAYPGTPEFAYAFDSLVRDREYQVRQIKSNIEYYRTRIAAWEEAPLPGILAGFSK
ncbi:MAG: hypothetical protein ABL984_00570 [Pyrinomonadaceae bacterium]